MSTFSSPVFLIAIGMFVLIGIALPMAIARIFFSEKKALADLENQLHDIPYEGAPPAPKPVAAPPMVSQPESVTLSQEASIQDRMAAREARVRKAKEQGKL